MSMPLIPLAQRGTFSLEPSTYGHSTLGAPLEIWSPPNRQGLTDLVLAGIHGDEPISTSLLSLALRSLQAQALQAHVILAANPDGLARGTRANARGVDLNRNFPTSNWRAGEVHQMWTTTGPRVVKLSAGDHSASEPEVNALLETIQALKIRRIVAVHAPLSIIDDPFESSVGRRLSSMTRLPLVRGPGYETLGSLGTWGIENHVHVITYELPDDALKRIYSDHFEAVLSLLTAADHEAGSVSPFGSV
jgi:murein peptide amidase A